MFYRENDRSYRTISLEGMEELCRKAPPRARYLIQVLWSTGLRISEALGLDVGDVWEKAAVKIELWVRPEIAKGKKNGRVIPLNSMAKSAFFAVLTYNRVRGLSMEATAPVWQSRTGRRLTRQEFDALLKRIRGDLKVSAHTFRHSFASRVQRSMHDLEVTRRLLGHASIMTTSIYLHPSHDELVEAINKI